MGITCGLAALAAFCGPVFPAVPPLSSPPTHLVALGGGVPGAMALSQSGLWVTVYGGRGQNRVVGVNPGTNRVFARAPVRGSPFYIAAGRGAVWVTGNSTRRGDVLQRIDPVARRVVASVQLPGRFAGPIAVGHRSVWVIATNHDVTRQWLVRIDRATDRVARSVLLGAVRPWYVEDLDVSEGVVWLLATRVGRVRQLPGDVLRFDPRTNRITARIKARALGMEVGSGGLWITACLDCRHRPRTDFAQRVDTRRNRPVGPRTAVRGVSFGPLFVARDRVWFGGYGPSEDPIAFNLDSESGQIERFLRVGRFSYSGMALDSHERTLWVARAAGGVLRVDLTDR
jgi:hypothetical protein